MTLEMAFVLNIVGYAVFLFVMAWWVDRGTYDGRTGERMAKPTAPSDKRGDR